VEITDDADQLMTSVGWNSTVNTARKVARPDSPIAGLVGRFVRNGYRHLGGLTS